MGTAISAFPTPSARVDNNAIADGFQIYLHGFIITAGEWSIVQQGLNDSTASPAAIPGIPQL